MLFSEEVLIKNEFAQNELRMLEVEKFSGNKSLFYELNEKTFYSQFINVLWNFSGSS